MFKCTMSGEGIAVAHVLTQAFARGGKAGLK